MWNRAGTGVDEVVCMEWRGREGRMYRAGRRRRFGAMIFGVARLRNTARRSGY